MPEPGIDHCVIDLMFHCECGTALVIIDRYQTERCDVCGRTWKVEVKLVDLSTIEDSDNFTDNG